MLPFGCQVIWYNSSDAKGPPPSNSTNPPSGAYMFRPNGVFQTTTPVVMQVVEGPVVTEIRQARRRLTQTWRCTTQHDLALGVPKKRQPGSYPLRVDTVSACSMRKNALLVRI